MIRLREENSTKIVLPCAATSNSAGDLYMLPLKNRTLLRMANNLPVGSHEKRDHSEMKAIILSGR